MLTYAQVADPKDVSPYVPDLLPIIKNSILDPSPEMRGIAAQVSVPMLSLVAAMLSLLCCRLSLHAALIAAYVSIRQHTSARVAS
jgi:hypothetical protein